MSCNTHAQSAKPPRTSLYEEITAHIIADLERGTVPWAQPWGIGAHSAPLGLPRNAATGKTYSGINILILWGQLFEKGFAAQHWLTFRQASALGGTVRKGEQGVSVCYADRFTPKQKFDQPERGKSRGEAGEAAADHQQPDTVPFLRRYTVFNVAQCDGLPDHCFTHTPVLPERLIVPQADALARATLADIRHGGAEAFYRPSADAIQLPPQQTFFHQIDYYRPLFHELGHYADLRIMPRRCVFLRIGAQFRRGMSA